MDIAKNTPAAIILSTEWRHFGAVKLYLGLPDNPSAKSADGASHLEAHILDGDDSRGLWVELNTGQKKWPSRPVQKIMIPWRFVLAVIIQPNLEPGRASTGFPSAMDESKTEEN